MGGGVPRGGGGGELFQVRLVSFGAKHRSEEDVLLHLQATLGGGSRSGGGGDARLLDDANRLVLDCRAIKNNPHHEPELKALTGRDACVQQYVMADNRARQARPTAFPSSSKSVFICP